MEDTEDTDTFKVSGRGELHLSILIETMRREGYEFAVSKAEVIYKTDERGKKLEPMELAYIDVPEEFSGSVIQKLSLRKGELQGMSIGQGGYTRLEFSIPSRGLIGYRGEFLTDTKGNGIMNTIFDGYGPYKGISSTGTWALSSPLSRENPWLTASLTPRTGEPSSSGREKRSTPEWSSARAPSRRISS